MTTSVCSPGRADFLYSAVKSARDKYSAELEALATWCDAKGLAAEAEKTRAWLKPRDPSRLHLAVLPQRVGPTKPPADASKDLLEWHARFGRLRRDQAEVLFGLARGAARGKRPSLAFDLALTAIREDPDNEAVRRLLGYQKFRGGWHTPWEVGKLRSGHVWSDRFGWLRKADLIRYEKGERRYKNRWVSTEEDARLRRDIHDGWVIETEHYTVRTNHAIEAGVALGIKLEQLYRVWKQLFVRYYATEQQVTALFESRNRSRRIQLPRHKVVYFRDREDYNRSLRPAYPNIGISVGIYVENTRRAYFFAGEDHDERTLYHEATHQLFHESRPVAKNVGRKANFWIIEGIAVYMETLRREDDTWVLGGRDDVRMKAARYRLLRDRFYVPLNELSTYGMRQVQADPRIATLYSQIAGLTQFLVHSHDGRYRDALVAYLTAVYNGSQDPALLSRLIGLPYPELDRQYREFLEQGGK